MYKSNTIKIIKKVCFMNKLFILVGPSAAGKTLISNFLVHKDVNILQNLINVVNDLDKSSMLENLNIVINTLEKSPFNKIITSTSRPQREKEIPVSYTHLDVYKRQYISAHR